VADTVTPDATSSPVESSERAAAIARRQRRIPMIVGIFIAAILVLALGLVFVLRNVHIEINSGSLVSVQIPLNVCKTNAGSASLTPSNLPTSVRVKLPSAYSTKLAFYADSRGVIEAMAPVGWSCTALSATDGSSSLQIAPPAPPIPASGESLSGSTAEVIIASQTGGCVACRESLACPLFKSAASDYESGFGQSCLNTKPSLEVVTRRTKDLVEFTDPPGVIGDASDSGGAYPSLGVLTYIGEPTSDGSWTETCLLPPTDTPMCKAIIDNFVHRYGKR
jgi:hypothetical protein